MTLDPSVLAAVKQAGEALRPSSLPWKFPHRGRPGMVMTKFGCLWNPHDGRINVDADAAYIVAACNAAPALIAEIERLTAQVEGITAGAKPCVLAESDD